MNKRYYVLPEQFRALIATAYDLSVPQGLGWLHASDGPLDDVTISDVIARSRDYAPISMDYIHGRAVKFHVRNDAGRFWFDAERWYDHSEEQLRELARRLGLAAEEHEDEQREAPAPLRSSEDDVYVPLFVAAAVYEAPPAPAEMYQGGGGGFAGGGASGSWDSDSSSSADFSNVSSGSDSTAASGGD